jgi:phosphoribosylamine--glycine ligase
VAWELADCVPIDTSNIIEVADFAQTISADLTVVGPELPMVLGMGDEFRRRGLSIFCPSRAAAEIEGSKALTVAVRRSRLKKDISPTTSPGWMIATRVGGLPISTSNCP